MKGIINQLGFIKINSVCSVKDNVKIMRRQATNREKRFAKDISDKGLSSKISKELLKLNNKKGNDPTKLSRDLHRHHVKDMQMKNKHMKRGSTSHVIRKMQIKTT